MKSLKDAELDSIPNVGTSCAYYHQKNQWPAASIWATVGFIGIVLALILGYVISDMSHKGRFEWFSVVIFIAPLMIFLSACFFFGAKSKRRWENRLCEDVFFIRAELIERAVEGFKKYRTYYQKWYEAVQCGAKHDPRLAEQYVAFLQAAKKVIVLAEANFRLARERVEMQESGFVRNQLTELMSVLGRPSSDCLSGSVDAMVSGDEDEEALQKTVRELLSLPLSPEYVPS